MGTGLLERPVLMPRGEDSWRDRAACLPYPTEWWFAPRYDQNEQKALGICGQCPVRQECLDESMTYPMDQDMGIRGGRTARQRRRMRNVRNGPTGPRRDAIHKYLLEHKDVPASASEIAEFIGESLETTRRSLREMDEVEGRVCRVNGAWVAL